MAVSHTGQSPLVHSLATLLRNDGDSVLDGSSTLTLQASSLQQLTRLFEQYLLSRSQQHGFLALPSHPADTASLLQLQFLFDVLQKTISLKLINTPGERLQSVVKIFPFKSLKCLELKRIPPHCLEGLRGVYSQLEVFTCSKSIDSMEELLSLCGGDLSSALPWLELHTLNFSYNSIVCLDQSLSLLNVLKSLDLSHNKIEECAEFLKPLSELEHLNLGYNCLQRAPTLGLSAKAKLLTLILRNNELETINGVEQLSSLQHLDLAYNLLLEHSQLAPLSMLHCLSTLSLEGNPLYFQKTHRISTVRHLSPKAAHLKLKLDGTQLSSSELSVLPKPGQLIGQSQVSPPVTMEPERGNLEVSSGAGELSDSLSVGDVGVTRTRKKKTRSKVKVRRASISERSDTDYEPRPQTSTRDIALPHKEEIERMDSFREQLGEDWLRYQHHLEGAPPSTLTNPASTDKPNAGSQTLTNGLSVAPCPSTDQRHQPSPLLVGVPEVLPRPLLYSEPMVETTDGDADQETESTLEWSGRSPRYTESTLESSMMDSQGQGTLDPIDVSVNVFIHPGHGYPRELSQVQLEIYQVQHGYIPSPVALDSTPLDDSLDLNGKGSQGLASKESGDTKEEEEEEEDLGVDLCLPLLVGVLPDKEKEETEGWRRREVFLRVKQGLLLEVDMQQGLERCRLELDALARVDTTQATWNQEETERLLPAVELQFHYISRERRRRLYVMLDDNPQQALQALTDVLSLIVEENHQRHAKVQPSRVHLQCLRCSSEFTLHRGGREEEEDSGRGRRRGASPRLTESIEGLDGTEGEPEEEAKGSNMVCPECGSDHVVQLAGQSATSTSTPMHRHSGKDTRDAVYADDHVSTLQRSHHASKNFYPGELSSRGGSLSSSPILNATTTTGDPDSFVTAQGSSFFMKESEDDTGVDRSLCTGGQRKEELAGSYHYASVGASPPGGQSHIEVQPPERASLGDHLDLLSEDYEAVDHRLKLFLDVEVFEEEEEFHSFLRMSTVKYGEPGEFPSLLVVSDQRIYFLELASEPHGGQLSDWLQKRDSHPIMELSYLEVGLGSQSIHMEFEEGAMAYTLLVRDSSRCKRFFSLLTGIVREMAPKTDSKLKSISTARLDPQHHLWPLLCEDAQTDTEDSQPQFYYLLAFVLQEDSWTPLTVLATRETLHLIDENHQWSKSLPNISANEDGEPCSGKVTVLESQPVSCVSSVNLWTSNPCQMDIKLYDETVKQEKTWCVRTESPELVQGLLSWVRTQWEAMFGVKLTTSVQDTVT